MRCFVAVSSVIALIISVSSRAEADPAVAAAQARQDAAKTIALEFQCTEVLARGAFSHQDLAEPLPGATNVRPREETTRKSTNRLVIDGTKVRYEDNHTPIALADGSIHNHSSLKICDGSISKTFFPEEKDVNHHPMGIIDTATSLDSVKTMLLWPITMTFRAFDSQLNSLTLAALMPTGVSLSIEGVECREYEIKTGGRKYVRFLLDPNCEFIPRRISSWNAGVLRAQLDIAFERREPGSRVPVSWVWKEYFSGGNPSRTTRVEVVSLQLNEPQSPDQFDISFPPGTSVNDNPKKKAYIVQANGDMHEVTLAFTELPNPVTVAAQPGVRWYQQYKFLLAGLTVMLFLAVILVLILWKKKHSSS